MPHSPAPWSGEAVTQDMADRMRGPLPQDFIIVGNDSVVIGVLYDYAERCKLNANLIIAAPELLKALNAIVKGYDGPTVDAATAVSSHIQAARMAIAKAEGK